MPWCVHDLRYLIAWAAGDLEGFPMLDAQVDWLAGVLAARGMPPKQLVAALELAAEAVREREPDAGALAERLADGARGLRERASG